MPADTLPRIDGDPIEVASAARSFESLAADVAATSAKLRALASANGFWSGAAARDAQARALTLPPKLDKAHASYRLASTALRRYATCLSNAQHESETARRAAAAAKADLDAAEAAKRAAADQDAAAAAAAAATGQPAPPPTAPRHDPDIAHARQRLARAEAANDIAHHDQQAAADAAAATLRQASRQGIHNKPWWRHALSAAGSWVHAAWTHSLRFVAKAATAISALAGLAALALTVAGIVFPPLEAAAATLEAISLVSGALALVSQAGLAATGDASWTTVGIDALAMAPAAASIGGRLLAPTLRKTRIVKRTMARLNRSVHEARPASRIQPATSETLSAADTWSSPSTLTKHFSDHGRDFSAATEDQYADMASAFLRKSQTLGYPTKIAPDGTIRVFEPETNTFGAYAPSGKTRTFFKPSSNTYWSRQPGVSLEDLMKR